MKSGCGEFKYGQLKNNGITIQLAQTLVQSEWIKINIFFGIKIQINVIEYSPVTATL